MAHRMTTEEGISAGYSVLGDKDEYDVRGNQRLRSLAESKWAVRVLRGMPDWLAKIFWEEFIQTIHDNTQANFPAHGMDLEAASKIDGSRLTYSGGKLKFKIAAEQLEAERAPAGVAIALAVCDQSICYKEGLVKEGPEKGTSIGLDTYIDARSGSSYKLRGETLKTDQSKLEKVFCLAPDGSLTSMFNRKQSIRNEFLFCYRGRSGGTMEEEDASEEDLSKVQERNSMALLLSQAPCSFTERHCACACVPQ